MESKKMPFDEQDLHAIVLRIECKRKANKTPAYSSLTQILCQQPNRTLLKIKTILISTYYLMLR